MAEHNTDARGKSKKTAPRKDKDGITVKPVDNIPLGDGEVDRARNDILDHRKRSETELNRIMKGIKNN